MIFINSYHTTPPRSHPVICFLNKKVIARLYCLLVARQCLESITAEHIYQSENHFQSHSHHTPLPPKHPLTINDIGPPIALTMEVIIVSPLILSYKYEKLKGGKGCWKVHKEVRKGERIEWSRGKRKICWVSIPKTTQKRKLKPTIQIDCEPKWGQPNSLASGTHRIIWE